ncbi:MAG: DUF6371 domain-containing protein [Bacteroidales bacterium]|nr:DUF6371 domain-containing protein [Bacteroidales bacterium]
MEKTDIEKAKDISILAIADKLGLQISGRGTWKKTLCFLHDDHNPSMKLNESYGCWKCMACGQSGGSIDLVMRHENINFPRAVEWILTNFANESVDDVRKKIEGNTVLKQNTPRTLQFLDPDLAAQLQSSSSTFAHALRQNGILTHDQVNHAVKQYHLGVYRDTYRQDYHSVVFWQIDELNRVHEGKIMHYLPNCHRDKQKVPGTISNELKMQKQLDATWKATPCLFGLHLINHNLSATIAIVESEKTAVIMSEINSERDGDSDGESDGDSQSLSIVCSHRSNAPVIWLASGGLTALTPQMFLPLKGRKIILFPDTDPKQEAYSLWKKVALKAEELIQTPIYVSDILERLATPTQKERKIDVADLIDNGQQTTDCRLWLQFKGFKR